MTYMRLAALVLLMQVAVPTDALAGGLLGDFTRSIGKSVTDAGKSLDKANQDVGRAVENAVSSSAQADVIKAQAAIKEAEEKQKEVEKRFAELATLSIQVDNEKQTLEKEKAALQARETLFSMGFYASFTTTLLAIFGLVVKMPTTKLEKQLKVLEIQEKELAIRERLALLAEKPNPSTGTSPRVKRFD